MNIEKIPIHIKVCKRPNVDPRASTLVFDTLRVGFPNNPVMVWQEDRVESWKNNGKFPTPKINFVGASVTHWGWIHHLLSYQTEPFFILDTDIAFSECVYSHFPDMKYIVMGGEFIPQHLDVFTGVIMCGKLHTSFMYLDPVFLFEILDKYVMKNLPDSPCTPKNITFIDPFYFALRNVMYYHDTLSSVFHLLNIRNTFWFPKSITDCYVHLHVATWIDVIKQYIPDFGNGLETFHKRIYDGDKSAIAELKAQQAAYYEKQSTLAAEIVANEDNTLPFIEGVHPEKSRLVVPLQ